MSKFNTLLGFVAGAAAGIAMGILYAPDRGETTRKKIKNQALKVTDDMRENLAHKVDDLNQFVSSFVRETKEKIDDLEKKARQEVQGVKEKAAKKS
jgi:gas vesicle protein